MPLVEPPEHLRKDAPLSSLRAPSFLERIPGLVFTKLHRGLVRIAGDIRETRNGEGGPSRGWLSQAQHPYGQEGTFRTVLYPVTEGL